MKIVIIDYGMGNLRSVKNAFDILGEEAQVSDNPETLRTADRIVLPGVGAFGDGMYNLVAAGWIDILEDEVRHKKKPFLGLCLGMQLLADRGTEHGIHDGLKWIPGVVERIPETDTSVRIPHIGWNDVSFVKKRGMYSDMGSSKVFYFVHSYIFLPKSSDVVSGVCYYGTEFVASIEMENIWATQYHPEKSQKSGLNVLKNFLDFQR